MAVSMIPKCVTFELILHVAFVADENWGDTLEPACNAAELRRNAQLYWYNSTTKYRAAHVSNLLSES